MSIKATGLVIALAGAVSATIAQGQPQTESLVETAFANEENAEERINFSGKLRMLSQRIPSAACHFARGIDVEGSSKLLVDAPAEFEKILTALEFGDPDLNIQNPEPHRKSLARIHALRKEWEPLKAAAATVANGSGSDEDLEFIAEQNMAVLGAAIRLVSELVRQYSNPNAVAYADLLLIDISGRQRMLTQKMSKESCMAASGNDVEVALGSMTKTIQIFEASLDALRYGLPDVGIKPPPNDEIAAGLDEVYREWGAVKPQLDIVLSGDGLEPSADADKFRQLNVTMSDMNTVVGMYTAATKPKN